MDRNELLDELSEWDESQLGWLKEDEEWGVLLVTYDGGGRFLGHGDTPEEAYQDAAEEFENE